MSEENGVTLLLRRARRGECVTDELMPLIYHELHRLARRCMRTERGGHMLQATALVHEAYLELVGAEPGHWQDRAHFFATAATVVRRILVQHARSRQSLKRGRGWHRVRRDVAAPGPCVEDRRLLRVEAALQRLSDLDPDKARLVELRFFAGLTTREIAAAMRTSERTVARSWDLARAWLTRELRKEDDHDA